MVDRTRSELEHLFLRLCKEHGLPMPEVNVRIDALLVDFLWRERQLIVETDGFKYHSGRAAFEDDRDRDLRLKALGFEVLRLSYRQVVEEPTRVAELLTTILSRA
jgi:very-short-patch-repair endonuclease